MLLRLPLAIVALVALLDAVQGAAYAAGGGAFSVNISLNTPGSTPVSSIATGPASGICVSQSLSAQSGALVQVACQTGQFVSIAPRPGAAYAGSNGFAYIYWFNPSAAYAVDDAGALVPGAGTVATFRVFSLGGSDELVDLLVSF